MVVAGLRARLAKGFALLVATVLLATAVGTVVADVAVAAHGGGEGTEAGWPVVLSGIAMGVPGILLLWRLPWHPIAIVLTGFGAFWAVDGLAGSLVSLAWVSDRDAWWAAPAFWIYARLGSALILSVQLLMLLYPEGRLAGGAWRPIAWISIALGAVMPLAFIGAPASALGTDDPSRIAMIEAFDRAPTPPLPDELWLVLLAAAPICLALSLVGALATVIGRRRGADSVRRAQLRWLAWSGAIFIVGIVLQLTIPFALLGLVLPVTIGLISASVVVAVTRYRLYEIDRLLSWTIVSAVLVAAIVALDALIVVSLGAAIDDRVAMLVAVVAVTIVYAPLRDRMLGLAARFVSGRRGDPYAVVSRLVARLEVSADRQQRLTDLAEAIADTFGSRSVRVELGRPGEPRGAVQLGERRGAPAVFPIEYGGEVLGVIELEPGRRPIASVRDQRLLGDLVRLAAVAVEATEASTELQAIREQLVLAREDERSRLRRDLHDGLGPLLAGVKLRLEAASNLAERDPARARGILDDAIDEQSEVIGEIRRITHDLRPPALDDLGFAQAIAQLGARMSDPAMTVEVHGSIEEPLPPAVEVAAYRIVAEALTNARRHAAAAIVRVGFAVADDRLRIEIDDDGIGLPDGAAGGIGLRSMRERSEELGGRLVVAPRAGGGTRVRAELPLRTAAGAAPRTEEETRAG